MSEGKSDSAGCVVGIYFLLFMAVFVWASIAAPRATKIGNIRYTDTHNPFETKHAYKIIAKKGEWVQYVDETGKVDSGTEMWFWWTTKGEL